MWTGGLLGDTVEVELLNQGVRLMYVGMGTVFVFLTILVAAMSVLSAVLRMIAARLQTQQSDTGVSEEEIAVISAAIAQHKNNNTTQIHDR